MVYPAISSRRMPYDIDGTEVGTRFINMTVPNAFAQGIQSWLGSTDKVNLNKVQTIQSWQLCGFNTERARLFWFFFPEKREITGIGFYFSTGTAEYNWQPDTVIQGSNDTTNGMDGTWETATWSPPQRKKALDFWRTTISAVSFSTSYKVIRIGLGSLNGSGDAGHIHSLQLYGQKAAGEMPDDLVFCDASTGAEKTALMDWGDQPEGTTEIDSFKVKNASTDKIATDINLQLNHDDFVMAWSPDGPWTTVLDIATLGVGALSNTIYVRNKLGPPLLILGPYAARVIASVGSWS